MVSTILSQDSNLGNSVPISAPFGGGCKCDGQSNYGKHALLMDWEDKEIVSPGFGRWKTNMNEDLDDGPEGV